MKKRRKSSLIFWLLVILALIVLPTGTPEDLVTSVPLIMILGFEGYLLLCLIVLILIILFLPKKYMKRIWG